MQLRNATKFLATLQSAWHLQGISSFAAIRRTTTIKFDSRALASFRISNILLRNAISVIIDFQWAHAECAILCSSLGIPFNGITALLAGLNSQVPADACS